MSGALLGERPLHGRAYLLTLHDHIMTAVLIRYAEPAIERAVRLVPDDGFRNEREAGAVFRQSEGELDVFGTGEALIKPSHRKQVLTPDGRIRGVKLARCGRVDTGLHGVVLLRQHCGFPAK